MSVTHLPALIQQTSALIDWGSFFKGCRGRGAPCVAAWVRASIPGRGLDVTVATVGVGQPCWHSCG